MVNVEKSIGQEPIRRKSRKEQISRRRKALVAVILTSIIGVFALGIVKTYELATNIPESIESMVDHHAFTEEISSKAYDMLKEVSYVNAGIQGYNHISLARAIEDQGNIDLWLYGTSKALENYDKDVNYNMDSLIFQLSLIDENFKNGNITNFEKYVNSLGYNSIDEYKDNQINILYQQYNNLEQKGVSK